jgi:hypothetical protein
MAKEEVRKGKEGGGGNLIRSKGGWRERGGVS